MVEKAVVRCCDRTDHGGIVLEGYALATHKGHRVAGLGHQVYCPRCNGIFPIVEATSAFLGIAPALDGMRTGCGARLIASQTTLMLDDESGTPEPAARRPTQGRDTPATSSSSAPAQGASVAISAVSGQASAMRIVFRIGLFNDGSGNNFPNSRKARALCSPEAIGLDKHPGLVNELLTLCRKREGMDDISYAGGETNVHRLRDLYAVTDRLDETTVHKDGRRYAYLRAYIEGIGTKAEHKDSLFAYALGEGPTGVIARAQEAIDNAIAEIKRFLGNNAGRPVVIDAVEFDLFGFSRGAAASRHVAWLIRHGKDESAMARALREAGLPLKPGWRGDNDDDLRIRFIGLFDTVAAIGIPDNDNNDPVKLYLADDCADNVVQLTARDECRLNFALNRVKPGKHTEIALPGVHSDLGGGYTEPGWEQAILTRPEISLEPLDNAYYQELAYFARRYGNSQSLDMYLDKVACQSIAWQRTARQLDDAPLLRHGWLIDPSLNSSPYAYRIRTWTKVVVDRERPYRDRVADVSLQVMAALVVLRQVRSEYQLVSLRIMHALAQEAGVPFSEAPDDVPALSLPKELLPICHKLLAYARDSGKGELPLSREEQQWLARRYLHQSAHWNPSEWNPHYEAQPDGTTRATLPSISGTGPKIVFTNRPAPNRVRRIFNQKKGH